MTVGILTTGTELVRGELVDTNTGWLAGRLTELGHLVTEHGTVGDDDADIRATLLRLGERHEVVIVTGGLGPTTDDRTTACMAEVVGVPLVRDTESLHWIRERFARAGRVPSPSNEKQADFPEGATILRNELGTAPGFSVRFGRALFFFTPGVPREMKGMFENEIVPRLPPGERILTVRRLRTVGLPESEINDRLSGIEEEHGVVLGYRASDSEIEVKVFAERRPGEEARVNEERARGAFVAVKTRLGENVYSEGNAFLPEVLGQALFDRGLSFGIAESCTGGLVSELMTTVSGASRYFLGAVVSYDNRVKQSLLGVSEESLREHGAVSPEVAREMALGARRALGVDVALAITGIAGPDGGSEEKPVGTVHFAISYGDQLHLDQRRFAGSRTDIQRRAAKAALFLVLTRVRASMLPR